MLLKEYFSDMKLFCNCFRGNFSIINERLELPVGIFTPHIKSKYAWQIKMEQHVFVICEQEFCPISVLFYFSQYRCRLMLGMWSDACALLTCSMCISACVFVWGGVF